MIGEYLEAEKVGGGKTYIDIEVRVKADKVHDFAMAMIDWTIDEALKIIEDVRHDANKGYMFDMVAEIKNRIEALRNHESEGK